MRLNFNYTKSNTVIYKKMLFTSMQNCLIYSMDIVLYAYQLYEWPYLFIRSDERTALSDML